MPSPVRDVYVYGDANIDLIVPRPKQLPPPGCEWTVASAETRLGGGAALCASGLAKLGLKVGLQARIGADVYGDFVRESLRRTGVDLSASITDRTCGTGLSISFSDAENRSFLTYRGSTQNADGRDFDFAAARRAKRVHLTSYRGAENHGVFREILRTLATEGLPVSLDLGFDETGEWYPELPELLPFLDVLLLNEEEALRTARTTTVEEAMCVLTARGGRLAVKLGARGALACEKGTFFFCPSYPVSEVVDTTGAGDSFNAGLIYALTKNESLARALEYGNACGAHSVTKAGGSEGFPSREDLEAFLRERREAFGQ